MTSVGSSLTIATGFPVLTASNTNGDAYDDRVEVVLGDVVNTPDGSSGQQDQIEIRVTARVEDVLANFNERVLVNEATVDYGAGTLNAIAEAEVVEPVLIVDKSINTGSGPAGIVVTYTALVEHTALSAASAHDVVLEDLLADPQLALVPGSVTASRGQVVVGNSIGDTTIRVELADLLLSQQLTVTYDAAHTARPGRWDKRSEHGDRGVGPSTGTRRSAGQLE